MILPNNFHFSPNIYFSSLNSSFFFICRPSKLERVDLSPMEYLLSLNSSHVTRVLKDLQALSQEHDDAIATLESTKSIFLLHSNEDAWKLLKQHCDEEYTKTTNCVLEGRLPDHLFPDDECHGRRMWYN